MLAHVKAKLFFRTPTSCRRFYPSLIKGRLVPSKNLTPLATPVFTSKAYRIGVHTYPYAVMDTGTGYLHPNVVLQAGAST